MKKNILSQKDIHTILKKMANQRSIYHNERDFLVNFAILLHDLYPESHIRSEIPAKTNQAKTMDLLFLNEGRSCGFELKYSYAFRKKKITFQFENEDYTLVSKRSLSQLIQFEILKDISRLEGLFSDKFDTGYVIYITNDNTQWEIGSLLAHNKYLGETISKNKNSLLVDSTSKPISVKYDTTRKKKMKEPIIKTITLKDKYYWNWCEFSRIPADLVEVDNSYSKFQYLLVKIKPLSH